MRAKLAREWGVPGWFRMRYAYAETTPVLNLAAPSQIRGGWPEVGTTAAESTWLTHTTPTPHTWTWTVIAVPCGWATLIVPKGREGGAIWVQ